MKPTTKLVSMSRFWSDMKSEWQDLGSTIDFHVSLF